MTAIARSPAPHVVIVGGGGTGGALALDLVLRGLRVTLVERGEITSGTTGRHHGLLHSGARYAVNDAESAVECIEENHLLPPWCPDPDVDSGREVADLVPSSGGSARTTRTSASNSDSAANAARVTALASKWPPSDHDGPSRRGGHALQAAATRGARTPKAETGGRPPRLVVQLQLPMMTPEACSLIYDASPPRDIPVRLVTGAYIAHSGLDKWRGSAEQATRDYTPRRRMPSPSCGRSHHNGSCARLPLARS